MAKKKNHKWNAYFRPSHRWKGCYELYFFIRNEKNLEHISQGIRLTWTGKRFIWGENFINVSSLGERGYREIVNELQRLEDAIPSVFGNIVDQFNVTLNMFFGKEPVRCCYIDTWQELDIPF